MDDRVPQACLAGVICGGSAADRIVERLRRVADRHAAAGSHHRGFWRRQRRAFRAAIHLELRIQNPNPDDFISTALRSISKSMDSTSRKASAISRLSCRGLDLP